MGRPVVVLSNNDGCVVARSSNYELYASLSRRMMSVMDRYMAGRGAYSIDECFLMPPDHAVDTTCRLMRTAVLRGVGVPVTVTCAPTRTLAKILSHWAKHTPATGGVAVWDGLPAGLTEEIMAATPVGEVWGVGRLLEPKFMGLNATTALRLRGMDPAFVRRRFGLNLMRTVLELQGTPCISLDGFDAIEGRREHQIMCSRMFGHSITKMEELAGAVSVYAQQATARLPAAWADPAHRRLVRDQPLPRRLSDCRRVWPSAGSDRRPDHGLAHRRRRSTRPCEAWLSLGSSRGDALRPGRPGPFRHVGRPGAGARQGTVRGARCGQPQVRHDARRHRLGRHTRTRTSGCGNRRNMANQTRQAVTKSHDTMGRNRRGTRPLTQTWVWCLFQTNGRQLAMLASCSALGDVLPV